jgi:hypothetical protein
MSYSKKQAIVYWSTRSWTVARTLPQVSDAGQSSGTQPAGGWVVQGVIDHYKKQAIGSHFVAALSASIQKARPAFVL